MKAKGNRIPFSASLRVAAVVSMAFASLPLIGCSVKEKLDGMYDSTQQLAKGTDDLDKKQGELYDALRQGNALQARRDIMNALLNAQDPARKISEAGKYFSAFDYQIWSNLGLDTIPRREALETLAAREFMRDVQEFIQPDQTEPAPLPHGDPQNHDQNWANREACLNALAVAMHLTNPKQDEMVAAHPEIPSITMYSMIQTSLRAKPLIDSGTKRVEDFPGYVREVLIFEDVARLLVQARFNFFGAMLLGSTSTIRDGDHTHAGWAYWVNYNAGKMRYFDWQMSIENQGLVQIQEESLYLIGALRVATFMKEIGMTPKLDSDLHGIFAHAQYPDTVKANIAKVHALSAAGTDPLSKASPLARAQTDLIDRLETYRQY